MTKVSNIRVSNEKGQICVRFTAREGEPAETHYAVTPKAELQRIDQTARNARAISEHDELVRTARAWLTVYESYGE